MTGQNNNDKWQFLITGKKKEKEKEKEKEE